MAKVLVIDDCKMMRLYLRRCLEAGSFEVEDWMPLSAMEIADHLSNSQPDLILSDDHMPGLNGATVLRMARKTLPDIPVLIISAFCDADMETNLTRMGAKEVLSKPIEQEVLLNATRRALTSEEP